jgi:uncharacterized protein with ParB-like and HNH nuclease domain
MIYNTKEIPKSKLDVEYYGADFPVDVLVKRMETEDFIIPNFQREYVWKEKQASRFIESLLLGLPTPTLFLAKDKFSNKYLVIDGQQRLKTLQYFYQESFPAHKVFKLQGVVNPFNGLTYSQLSPSDRRSLDNAIIHCIIISENYDSSGIFYIFERLNTTGTPLNSQEIRNVIYHGAFSDLIKKLSQNEDWRDLCEKSNNKATEQELILRFLALYFDLENYSGNITDFLNSFMLNNKNLELISQNEIQNIFINTIEFIKRCIGSDAFYHRKDKKKKKSFNPVLYESLMILTARELTKGLDCSKFIKFYGLLIEDNNFWSLSKDPTVSRKNVLPRLNYVNELYRNMH